MARTGVGTVGQLWRYPAKSMGGQLVDVVRLIDIGVEGDRRWAIRDLGRGGIGGAKKIPGLMNCSASFLDGSSGDIAITLPSGTTVQSDDPAVDDALSAALGRPVQLDACALPTDLDHFRRGAPDSDDLEEELRAIFGREPNEPLPDLSQFPAEIIEFESPPGTYVDVHPIHLLTTTSLGSLATLVPDSRVDVRRFRPNIVVDDSGSGAGPWPEQGWIGRSIRLGGAVLDVVGPCPRCVMVTRPVADLPEDTALLRSIVADADQNLGVYATVRSAGEVRAGASVQLVDR